MDTPTIAPEARASGLMARPVAPPLYLASSSPRRRALLDQIGVCYRTLPVSVDETRRDGEPAQDYVTRLALAKARCAWRSLLPRAAPAPVLGADTVVVLDGEPLGKPGGRAQALAMLARLSGRRHRVMSAVALVEGDREAVRLNVSRVSFRRISAVECEAYWASGEPADKAGAYAIQGRGAVFVRRLEGSYSGVMGLPLFDTAELLREFGIEVCAASPPAHP